MKQIKLNNNITQERQIIMTKEEIIISKGKKQNKEKE